MESRLHLREIGTEELSCELGDDQANKKFIEDKCQSYNEETGDLNQADGYDCPICKNKGNVMVCVQQKVRWYSEYTHAMRECTCMAVRKGIQRIKRSGLSHIIQAYTFEHYQTLEPWQQYIKDCAIEFVHDKDAQFFFVGGNSGAGKTHICTAICNALMTEQRREVRYTLWMDESKALKALVNDAEYAKATERLKQVDVLYIDDFLKTANGSVPTKGDLNLAIELINSRYNAKDKLTLISSEFTVADIVEMDEALAGRIIEAGKEKYEINISKDRRKNWRLRNRKML